MRQTSSPIRCCQTARFSLKGASIQVWRSTGGCLRKRTSAMHQRSSPFFAVTEAPSHLRKGLCEPVASITWSARSW